MVEAPANKRPEPASASEGAKAKRSKLRWLLGWVIVPLSLIAALFLAGVHVGARHPQMWMSRAVLWMFDAEPQLAPEGPPVPLARRLHLAVLPSTGHSLGFELDEAELASLVERGAGSSAATLDCAEACRLLWEAEHPERAFIEAERCELTPAEDSKPAVIDCEARVQRGK